MMARLYIISTTQCVAMCIRCVCSAEENNSLSGMLEVCQGDTAPRSLFMEPGLQS